MYSRSVPYAAYNIAVGLIYSLKTFFMKALLPVPFFLLLFHALVSPVCSQVPEAWKYTSHDEIMWQEVNSLGNLIVETRSALVGIDPQTGKEIWSCGQFGNISRSQVKTIPGSPLLSISRSNLITLVEPFRGKTLFNSEEAGISTIDTTCFLYRNNGILLTGKKTGSQDPIMIMVNMNDGKISWRLEEKFGKIIAVEELSPSEILVVTLFNNYKINSATGNIIWKNSTSASAQKLDKMGALGNALKAMAEEQSKNMNFDLRSYMPEDGKVVYLGSQNETQSSMNQPGTAPSYTNSYFAYRVSDGSSVWNEPVRMNGKIGQVALDPLGIIVLPDDGNRTMINMFDYETQAGKWGKKLRGIPVKGGIYDYIRTEKGYVLVSKAGERNYLNFLDQSKGILTFEEPLKINGLVRGIIPVSKGILFITSEEINILDPATGKFLLDVPVTTRPELTARKDQLIYAFDVKEKKIVSIDIEDASIKVISAAPLVFEGKESPQTIELRENGVFINSDQNVALVGYDGTQIYNNYYPAPRESGLKRALLYAQAIRAAYISANSYYISAAFQSAAPKADDALTGAVLSEVGKAYSSIGDAASDFARESLRQANARLKATSMGRDFIVLLMQEDKAVMLSKINKTTGKAEASIDLGKDRAPDYAVDDITGQIYLKTSSGTISSMKL
jgi:outer membrane protein assembly factor BamB